MGMCMSLSPEAYYLHEISISFTYLNLHKTHCLFAIVDVYQKTRYLINMFGVMQIMTKTAHQLPSNRVYELNLLTMLVTLIMSWH